MAQVAKELTLNRQGLYKAFPEKENPSFISVVKALDNLGFRIRVEQKTSA
jgi:DNA-binding phage protein